MKNLHNPPAFPRVGGSAEVLQAQDGMDLRDYFAGQALIGWYSGDAGLPHDKNIEGYAAHFYKMADAMLAERLK